VEFAGAAQRRPLAVSGGNVYIPRLRARKGIQEHMAKKPESNRSESVLPPETGKQAAVDSGPPGDGSPGVWTDRFGRLCIGNECFHAAVDQERKEIRVVIDESGPCGGADQDSIKAVVNALKDTVAEGAETLYQTKSAST